MEQRVTSDLLEKFPEDWREFVRSVLEDHFGKQQQSLTPAGDLKLPSAGPERTREEFDVPFCRGRGGMTPEGFWDIVERCLRGYKATEYRAPILTMVQASGTGKSRLLKEAALLRPLPYVTLDYNSAYPRGSHIVASNFREISSEKDAYDALANLLDFALLSYDEAAHNPAFLWDILELVSEHQFFWKPRKSETLEASTERLRQSHLNFKEATQYPFVLVAIDEAHHLLERGDDGMNAFRYLRRAARKLAGPGIGATFGLLFVSTMSRVQNFAPSLHRDSARTRDVGANLFAPLYDVGGWNTLTQLPKLSQTSQLDWVCRFGRFLWSAIATTRSAEAAKHVADIKLGSYERRLVASLGAVLHCHFSPSLYLAEELVRNNMAILKFVADDRETLVVEYPVEPLVTLAGANILIETPLAKVAQEIHLHSCFGTAFRGAVGETAAMLRCLGACWEHSEASLDMIAANDFISTLLGVDVQPGCFDGHSKVGLTGFVRSQSLDHRTLAWAFSLRLGLVTRPCYPAIDLIIPVYLDGDDQDGLINPKRMAVVAVQVKNREQSLSPAEFAAVAEAMLERLNIEGFVGVCVVLQAAGSNRETNGVYGASLVHRFPWFDSGAASKEMHKMLRADITATDYEKGSNSESSLRRQLWMEEVDNRSRPGLREEEGMAEEDLTVSVTSKNGMFKHSKKRSDQSLGDSRKRRKSL